MLKCIGTRHEWKSFLTLKGIQRHNFLTPEIQFLAYRVHSLRIHTYMCMTMRIFQGKNLADYFFFKDSKPNGLSKKA